MTANAFRSDPCAVVSATYKFSPQTGRYHCFPVTYRLFLGLRICYGNITTKRSCSNRDFSFCRETPRSPLTDNLQFFFIIYISLLDSLPSCILSILPPSSIFDPQAILVYNLLESYLCHTFHSTTLISHHQTVFITNPRHV